MSAYVPPWKRKAAVTTGASPSAGPSSVGLPYKRNEGPGYSLTDIVEHLGGRKMGTINLFSYTPPPPVKKSVKEMLQEEREKEKAQRALETTPTASSSLLNSDASKSASSEVAQEPHPHGHLISWIHIVPDAHPLFLTENELWFHTNSEVVVDHAENLGRPIPFFGQPTYGVNSELSPEVSKNTRAPFYGYW
jgi:predicted CopG family antitoxin